MGTIFSIVTTRRSYSSKISLFLFANFQVTLYPKNFQVTTITRSSKEFHISFLILIVFGLLIDKIQLNKKESFTSTNSKGCSPELDTICFISCNTGNQRSCILKYSIIAKNTKYFIMILFFLIESFIRYPQIMLFEQPDRN